MSNTCQNIRHSMSGYCKYICHGNSQTMPMDQTVLVVVGLQLLYFILGLAI